MIYDFLRAKTGHRQGWFARLGVGWLLLGSLALGALAACGNNAQGKGADFGDTKNHIHSMVALPGHPGTLLVATHYGLFRTTDGGQTWAKVLGDSGQLAQNLMDINLTVSPVNAERVYVEAITFPDLPKTNAGIPGIYTSTDGGATWQLSGALTNLPSSAVYYMVAGSASDKQLYAYFQGLGAQGLFESMDAGVHWQLSGMIPDTQSQGLVVDPARPGHLFVYSENAGLSVSNDGGAHWLPVPGIKDGISKAVLVGSMMYATGDDGVFVSQDSGAHFTLTSTTTTFSFLGSSTAHPTTVFGLTGTQLFVTTDGGQTWKMLAIPPSHLLAPNLSVEPDSGQAVYLGNSYPVAVYSSSDNGQQWSQIAP